MNDAISRDAALEMISRTKEAANADEAGFTKSQRKAIKAIADLFSSVFKDLPALDVAPVVHARWEADGTCSACKNRSFSLIRNEKDGAVNFVGGNYCPVCGARMDGEAE